MIPLQCFVAKSCANKSRHYVKSYIYGVPGLFLPACAPPLNTAILMSAFQNWVSCLYECIICVSISNLRYILRQIVPVSWVCYKIYSRQIYLSLLPGMFCSMCSHINTGWTKCSEASHQFKLYGTCRHMPQVYRQMSRVKGRMLTCRQQMYEYVDTL